MIRGIVNQVKEGLIKIFSASGRYDETFEEREYFQHYGFSSRPLSGAEIIIINEGNHYIAVASDDRNYRIAIEEGEVALYTDEGDKVHLKRDNTIEIVSGKKTIVNAPEVNIIAETKVTMTTPLLEVSGDITAGGSVSDSVRSIAADRTIYNGHTHPGGGIPSGQM